MICHPKKTLYFGLFLIRLLSSIKASTSLSVTVKSIELILSVKNDRVIDISCHVAGLEIRSHSVLKIFCFPDIDNPVSAVPENIDSGFLGRMEIVFLIFSFASIFNEAPVLKFTCK